jgi:anti-anti-sigma factor
MTVAPTAVPCTAPSATPTGHAQFACRTGRATAHQLNNVLLITAEGEIDAANALDFAAYVVALTVDTDRLVLDLSHIEFLGIQGFSALQTINVRVAAAGVRWAMCTGPAVARVLRICDPAGALPVARTVDAALAVLQREQARLLQLVAQAR